MKKKLPLWGALLLVALYLIFGIGNDIPEAAGPSLTPESGYAESTAPDTFTITVNLPENYAEILDGKGSYTTKEDVAYYIHIHRCLPDNFITKDEARALGWEGGGLEPYAPGKCIGGDRFGNYEELLPDAPGRVWTECDIGTLGKDSRGAKRIVFSNDGLIYYNDDHYESFELLYEGFLQLDGE